VDTESIHIGDGTIDNVILISFDSLRSDSIANVSPVDAPVFALMRDRGVFFSDTIVQAPFTIPSHACMLSGLYPARTGVRDMHHKFPSGTPTALTILKEHGFATIASSPTTLLVNKGFEGVDHHIPFSHRKLSRAITQLKGSRFFCFLHYWDTHTPYETRLPGYKPGDVLLNLLKPLDRLKKVRFVRRLPDILWLQRVKRIRSMMKEHTERMLPAVKQGYTSAIKKADDFLSGLMSVLDATGVGERTLLVVTGDHGDSFSEHDEINRAVGLRYEHGQFLYDTILKVPLIFFCPARNIARKYNAQVQQVDILPTILDALRIEYEGSLDGSSLWRQSIMGGRSPDRAFTFSETVRESLDMEMRCARSATSKLIRDYGNDKFELYDLQADPDEKSNLWPGDGFSAKAALMSELQAFAEIGDKQQQSRGEDERQQVEKTLRSLGYMD
jgi:arylsulfatase